MSLMAIGLAVFAGIFAILLLFFRSRWRWRRSALLLVIGIGLLFYGLFTIEPDCSAPRFVELEVSCRSGVALDCRRYHSLAFQCERLDLLEDPPRFVE